MKYAFKSPATRFAAGLFDFTGSILTAPFRRSVDLRHVKKILVVRLDHLGDVVMTRPALAALHSQLPNVQIDLLVSREIVPLFEDAREVREVIGFDHHWFKRKAASAQIWHDAKEICRKLRAQNYDLAIDFRGDLRNIILLKAAGIKHVAGYGITGGGFLLSNTREYDWNAPQVQVNMSLLGALGLKAEAYQLPFAYSGSRKWRFWNSLGKELNPDSRFRTVIHPGAGLPEKRWPETRFKELAAKLAAIPGMELIIVGTEDEKKLDVLPEDFKVVDFRGRTELRDLPVLFDACHLFIGNDSGPAHVAAAQGISLVSIFSSENNPEVWKPWTRKALELLIHPDVTSETVYEKAAGLLSIHENKK